MSVAVSGWPTRLKVRMDEADMEAQAKRVSRVILSLLGVGAKVGAGETDDSR